MSDAALPLLGYWLLQEETDDYYYCSMLTFTKDCFYQVREQYKNETEGNLGTFSFDDRTNVITFNPTKDFSDEDLVSFSCQVLNVTETNLTIKTDEGELLNYTKQQWYISVLRMGRKDCCSSAGCRFRTSQWYEMGLLEHRCFYTSRIWR